MAYFFGHPYGQHIGYPFGQPQIYNPYGIASPFAPVQVPQQRRDIIDHRSPQDIAAGRINATRQTIHPEPTGYYSQPTGYYSQPTGYHQSSGSFSSGPSFSYSQASTRNPPSQSYTTTPSKGMHLGYPISNQSIVGRATSHATKSEINGSTYILVDCDRTGTKSNKMWKMLMPY